MRNFKASKKIITLVLFIVLTMGILYQADRLLCDKSEHGIRQAMGIYDQPKNTVDVVFIGSSHIYYNINTALLWENYGIASYDYGTAEQPLWITYYYIKELCKYQNPKLIVLDLYCPARFKENYQYDYLRQSINGMRFSLNKLQMIYTSCEPEHYFEYFPSIAGYHSRTDIRDEDWEYVMSSKEERASYKGYTPYFGTSEQEEPELSMKLSGGLTVKSEIYLQKIIDYTKKEDIDLFLIVAPYPTTDEDELVYNRVHEIADRNGLEFNSTNYYYDNMGLDFETDFNDDSHLNYKGGCKFTEYLGNEIKALYDIPDRRREEGYESWDRHVTEIEEIVQNSTS